MMRGALRSALSDRVKAGRLLLVDEFKLADIKTKTFNTILKKNLQLDSKVLLVDDANRNLELSARNVARLKMLRTEGVNVYDIIRNEWLVMTKRSAEALDKRLSDVDAKSEVPNA